MNKEGPHNYQTHGEHEDEKEGKTLIPLVYPVPLLLWTFTP